MKMTNIFGKNGSLLVAGALAFTFASCDTDTRSNQSTQREAENMYETETNEGADINDPSITYQEGEYQTTEADNYDYDRQYTYEERDVVVERVKNDLNRAEQSLEQLEEKMKTQAGETNEKMQEDLKELRKDLEETRQDLSNKLEELETSTKEEWENVRTETNESLRGFERDWEELRNRGINTENNTTLEDSEDVRGVAPGTGTREGEGF